MKTKNQIIKDIIENIQNHTEIIKNVGTRYYQYDRSNFIKFLDDTDIETLSTEIIQMILWNRIIYSDEDGVDIRTKELLEENKK